MNKYFLSILLISTYSQAEEIKLLCGEEGKVFDPKFAEELVINLEVGTIQSSYTIPGNLEIISQSAQYVTALNLFEEPAGGGIILVLDRISGIYIWTRSSPTRMLTTDEYTLQNLSYKGKCISPKPLL